jgi:hypothetical protein
MRARLFEVSPSVCSRLVTLENMSKASGYTSPFLKTNRRTQCAITHRLEEKRWSIAVAVTFFDTVLGSSCPVMYSAGNITAQQSNARRDMPHSKLSRLVALSFPPLYYSGCI